MFNLSKKCATLSAIGCSLMLGACGSDYKANVIGTWKDISKEHYITIEKLDPTDQDNTGGVRDFQALFNVQTNSHGSGVRLVNTATTESDINAEQFRAVLYAPARGDNSRADETMDTQIAMNHLSMPARMQNGVLMLQFEAGDIPVLYDEVNQLVVLNGTEKYRKIPEELARLKLDPQPNAGPMRNANH